MVRILFLECIIDIDPRDRDYYLAKFSTKYNYTEWYRHSNILGVNETVKALHYDAQNEIIFLAVEVMSNNYGT